MQKREAHIFFSIQASCLRLDRPTPFRLSSLQSITPPAANISPSGASRPHLPPLFFSYKPHNPSLANFLPSGLAGRRLTHLQPPPPTPLSQPFSSLFYRQHTPGFHSSSIFPFQIFPFNLLPVSLPTPFTSSVLLPPPQPADQTRNIVSRAGAACKAAGVRARSPHFFFLFLYFSFFSSFSSFPFPWRRGFAATPPLFFSFFLFIFVLIFSFFFSLFSFFFHLLHLLFSFYLCFYFSSFLFCFFFSFFPPFLSSLLPPIYFLLTDNTNRPSILLFFLFFFLSPFHTPHPFQPAFRQSFLFLFLLFFLSSTITPLSPAPLRQQ